jgi:hypothetical protein
MGGEKEGGKQEHGTAANATAGTAHVLGLPAAPNLLPLGPQGSPPHAAALLLLPTRAPHLGRRRRRVRARSTTTTGRPASPSRQAPIIRGTHLGPGRQLTRAARPWPRAASTNTRTRTPHTTASTPPGRRASALTHHPCPPPSVPFHPPTRAEAPKPS